MTARTMQAHPVGEHEAEQAIAHGASGMPTALVGMLLFIASEVMFFGGLFATYFNARATSPGVWGPPAGAHELDLPLAAVLTAILVASSFTMQFGVWAIRRGDTGKLKLWTGITLALGVLFLIGQMYDYSQLGFGIADGVFGTVFYTLTGFHGVHVTIGILMLLSLYTMSMRGNLPTERSETVEIVGLYWHFVDVVWIVIFTIVYLIP